METVSVMATSDLASLSFSDMLIKKEIGSLLKPKRSNIGGCHNTTFFHRTN